MAAAAAGGAAVELETTIPRCRPRRGRRGCNKNVPTLRLGRTCIAYRWSPVLQPGCSAMRCRCRASEFGSRVWDFGG